MARRRRQQGMPRIQLFGEPQTGEVRYIAPGTIKPEHIIESTSIDDLVQSQWEDRVAAGEEDNA